MSRLGLSLTPHGHLRCEATPDAPALEPAVAARLGEAFARGTGAGLLRLGAGEVGVALPAVFGWWRSFAARYIGAVCHLPAATGFDGAFRGVPDVPPLSEAELATLVLTAPMMPGAEYLTAPVLTALWATLGRALVDAVRAAGTDIQGLLKSLNPAWTLIGRVHFNLAENKRDPDLPFAFMVTYTSRLTAEARVQHVPLGQALREYAGAANRDKLLSLLKPVQRASDACPWLKAMVASGEIYHPLRWSVGEAARFLTSLPDFDRAGVVVRMPANWSGNRPPRPQVTATVGARPPSQFGLNALLDFTSAVTLEGAPLSQDEVATLLAGTESLVLLRGQWVEVDRKTLERTMRQFRDAETLAERDGLTFAEALRLLSGTDLSGDTRDKSDAAWSGMTAGPWLAETLRVLRNAGGGEAGSGGIDGDPGPALHGALRPYQKVGVRWLRLLSGLGLGACLADDMGLGKTIQVLSLLLIETRQAGEAGRPVDGTGHKGPSLLVAPASLLANWAAEIERFAPSLVARIVHGSAMPVEAIKRLAPDTFAGVDLAITSYGALLRMPALSAMHWRYVILDEAQAIKNPSAKQTKAAKALRAKARIALTGTPVENNLGDLWSIFDFINPGLLGTAKQFSTYAKQLIERQDNPYGPLRELVRPYILRRMKTDKSVIADLPDKTEVKAYCYLERKQAALYAQTVADLAEALKAAGGMQRRGIVLATMMRLKQICNHPSQWLGDNLWAEQDSGKLARLREIAEVVAARQEKMLVFTQFREMTAPLHSFLGGIFGRGGLVLHGNTAVKERKGLVQTFQEDETVPFFVLSLKAGGAGLNLTAASHVVHFDRWWNPAVENQATDRAFRIGQNRNVLVHKFVCRGTLEDRIDAMIESKKALSDNLLEGSSEINLTEMKDEDLLRLVALDLSSAMKD